MKKIFLLLCLCGHFLYAQPYIKKFWKPIIFEDTTNITFDRNNLIPIDQGEYKYADSLPDSPETIESIITAGNVHSQNESFSPKNLSADNIIHYLKDKPSTKKATTDISNIYVTPIRKVNID